MASDPWHHDLEGRGGNPYMTTSVDSDGGVLSRTGRGGGGGDPEATHGAPEATRIPAKTLQGLRPGAGTTRRCPVHWAAANTRGKQPLCEATIPGLSPRGRTTRRHPVNWGLRILRENNRNLDCGDVPEAIPASTCKCSV